MFKDIGQMIKNAFSGEGKSENKSGYKSGKDFANLEHDFILSQTLFRIQKGSYNSVRPGNPYDDYGLASDVYLLYSLGYENASVEELTKLGESFQTWKTAIESLKEVQQLEGNNKRNRDKLLENLTSFLVSINRRVNGSRD